MSVEALPTPAEVPQPEISQALRAQHEIDTLQLNPGQPYSFDLQDGRLSSAVNDQLGMTQDLKAVIKAGQEHFGVVSVFQQGMQEPGLLLTRFGKDGKRATIVGFVQQGSYMEVGRNQDDSYDRETSRRHFAFQSNIGGGFNILDLNSTNGTEVFLPAETPQDTASVQQHDVAKGSIRKLLSRRRAAEAVASEPAPAENPLDDFAVWAPKSAQVTELMREHTNPGESALKHMRSSLKDKLEDSYMPARWSAEELLVKAEALIKDADPQVIQDVREIVSTGKLRDVEITPVMGKWSLGDDEKKSGRLLDIYSQDPLLANILVQYHIGGFHGSHSGSLLSVLKHGLMPAADARANGVKITSGERIYSNEGGQADVSFGDWRAPETISRYAHDSKPLEVEDLEKGIEELLEAAKENEEMYGADHPWARNAKVIADDYREQIKILQESPDSEEAHLLSENFPIAYGVDVSKYDMYGTFYDYRDNAPDKSVPSIVKRVKSDIKGEFMVTGTVPVENMPVMAVPAEKISYVQSLLHRYRRNVLVVPLESLKQK